MSEARLQGELRLVKHQLRIALQIQLDEFEDSQTRIYSSGSDE